MNVNFYLIIVKTVVRNRKLSVFLTSSEGFVKFPGQYAKCPYITCMGEASI